MATTAYKVNDVVLAETLALSVFNIGYIKHRNL